MIGAGVYTWFPQYYFPLYTAIPLYFIVIGVLTIPILNKAMQMGHQKFQMAFMLSKAIKLFITILLCVLYVVFIKENNPRGGLPQRRIPRGLSPLRADPDEPRPRGHPREGGRRYLSGARLPHDRRGRPGG